MTQFTTNATAAPAIRLEYGADDGSPQPPRRGLRVASLLALLPGLVLPFLPFECDLSPARVVGYGTLELIEGSMDETEVALWLLAMPFFLILPVVVRVTRQVFGKRSTRLGRGVAYATGAAGAAAFAGAMSALALESSQASQWGLVTGGTAALALVGWLGAAVFSRPDRLDERASVAVLGPYAVTLVFCVVAWAERHQIGWYVALAPAAAATVELIAIARSLRRRHAGAAAAAAAAPA
jgi:hypothetical protein